jgi:phosphoribosylanthranilate isomerase
MKIKICGVVTPGEIELLCHAGIDGAGLWHGVPGGEADLSRDRFRRYAAFARELGVEPVLVTFGADVDFDVKYVQLHAYQLPKVVQALRRPGRHIVKVLHIRGGRCVEERLIGAYERAGVNTFLLDVTARDGRVGSTGETLPPDVAGRVVERIKRPFYLAGGITADRRAAYAELMAHPGFRGIDISTGARDTDGQLSAWRIEALDEAWRGVRVR